MPDATVREVREALALRERVIDFAVEAQGLDAATLQARFRGDASEMLGRPPNLPRRERRPAQIDLADIQGNVLRGYTLPARRVPVPADRRRRGGAPLMRRMLPQVATAEPWSERPPGRR